jgi:cytochrome c peroxidase
VEKAIASFERTLVSANSPFDRYHYGHQQDALSPAARRGLEVFRNPDKGNCGACHGIDNRYPQFPFVEGSGGKGMKIRFASAAAIPDVENMAFFTDGKFHNTGIGADRHGRYKDLGRYLQTHKEEDRGAFKTPSLRNVALTAPYMHDGSLKTLKDVIDFYVRGGNPNPHQDTLIHKLNLTKQERADLLAFL